MSIAELYEAFYVVLAHMDRIFEFWLTASFGAIVASHFMSGRMTSRLCLLLASVYALFSMSLLGRYLATGAKMVEFRVRLVDAGESYPSVAAGWSGVLGGLTFLAGFCAVLSFIWRARIRD